MELTLSKRIKNCHVILILENLKTFVLDAIWIIAFQLTLTHEGGKEIVLSLGIKTDQVHASVPAKVASVEPVPILKLVPGLPPRQEVIVSAPLHVRDSCRWRTKSWVFKGLSTMENGSIETYFFGTLRVLVCWAKVCRQAQSWPAFGPKPPIRRRPTGLTASAFLESLQPRDVKSFKKWQKTRSRADDDDEKKNLTIYSFYCKRKFALQLLRTKLLCARKFSHLPFFRFSLKLEFLTRFSIHCTYIPKNVVVQSTILYRLKTAHKNFLMSK